MFYIPIVLFIPPRTWDYNDCKCYKYREHLELLGFCWIESWVFALYIPDTLSEGFIKTQEYKRHQINYNVQLIKTVLIFFE